VILNIRDVISSKKKTKKTKKEIVTLSDLFQPTSSLSVLVKPQFKGESENGVNLGLIFVIIIVDALITDPSHLSKK